MIIRDAVKDTGATPIYLTRTSPNVISFLQSELVKHFTNGKFPETLHSQITYCLAQLLFPTEAVFDGGSFARRFAVLLLLLYNG